jgi:hypothetical protein
MPPRSLKSISVSIAFPAFVHGMTGSRSENPKPFARTFLKISLRQHRCYKIEPRMAEVSQAGDAHPRRR